MATTVLVMVILVAGVLLLGLCAKVARARPAKQAATAGDGNVALMAATVGDGGSNDCGPGDAGCGDGGASGGDGGGGGGGD